MTTTPKTDESALAAFMAGKAEIDALPARITAGTDDNDRGISRMTPTLMAREGCNQNATCRARLTEAPSQRPYVSGEPQATGRSASSAHVREPLLAANSIAYAAEPIQTSTVATYGFTIFAGSTTRSKV